MDKSDAYFGTYKVRTISSTEKGVRVPDYLSGDYAVYVSEDGKTITMHKQG